MLRTPLGGIVLMLACAFVCDQGVLKAESHLSFSRLHRLVVLRLENHCVHFVDCLFVIFLVNLVPQASRIPRQLSIESLC